MPAENNPHPGRNRQPGDAGNKNCCPKCGELLEEKEPPAGEELFPDDEFICPACCSGIYIEVKEE